MKLFECQYFNKLCSHSLDKAMLESAYCRYNDLDDPLRVNLFALILRELIRIIMEREAPDDLVKMTPWFQGYLDKNSNKQKVTRRERYRYAISGFIGDRVAQLNPSLDITDEIEGLAREINLLNKYAHFEKIVARSDSPDIYLDELKNVESVVSNYSNKFFNFKNDLSYVILDSITDDFNSILENRIEIMLKRSGQTLSSFDFQLTEFSDVDVKVNRCKVSFLGVAHIYYWSEEEDLDFGFSSEFDIDPIEVERQTEINVSSEFFIDMASLTISDINIEI